MTLRDGDFPRWKATSRIEEESMMLAKRGDKPLSYVELLQLTAQNDRLAAERDRLQAQNAQMREAWLKFHHSKPDTACADYREVCRIMQEGEPIEWHNPADVSRIAKMERILAELRQGDISHVNHLDAPACQKCRHFAADERCPRCGSAHPYFQPF
jgi:hypothetical protein